MRILHGVISCQLRMRNRSKRTDHHGYSVGTIETTFDMYIIEQSIRWTGNGCEFVVNGFHFGFHIRGVTVRVHEAQARGNPRQGKGRIGFRHGQIDQPAHNVLGRGGQFTIGFQIGGRAFGLFGPNNHDIYRLATVIVRQSTMRAVGCFSPQQVCSRRRGREAKAQVAICRLVVTIGGRRWQDIVHFLGIVRLGDAFHYTLAIGIERDLANVVTYPNRSKYLFIAVLVRACDKVGVARITVARAVPI
jgi:hypothetical protein